jgi:hypothetical protein
MRGQARGSCESKHSAREGGEGGLDADHASEVVDASAAVGRGALPLRMMSLTKAAFAPRCEPSAGANCKLFRGLVSDDDEGCGSSVSPE